MTNTTNTTNTYFKLGSDVNGALDLFNENLNRAKVIRKDGNTVMLIDGNKIISMITVLREIGRASCRERV